MKILKGLQSSIILDRCIEFNIKPEKNSITLYFYFSCGRNDSEREVIKKYYPLTTVEVEQLSSKNIEIDFICDKLIDSLCHWLSNSLFDKDVAFDLKVRAQRIIDEYLER